MADFQFANVPNAFEAGRQIGRQRQQENALAKAAKSFGAGDYKAASNDLFQYAPDLAMKTQSYGQQQAQQQARMQAGTMAAGGDLKGAAGALAGQGDLEGWASLDGAQRKRIEGMYDYSARVLYGLQNVPAEQRKAAALSAARNSPYADILVPETEKEIDWSDARLQAGIAGAMSVTDMIKQNTDAAKLEQGDRRIDLLERGVVAKERGGDGGYGKPPSGYRFTQGGDLEAIPGGEAAQKLAANKTKADNMIRMLDATKSDVLSSIAQAKKNLQGYGEVGAVGSVMRNVPGTKAHDLQQNIATIVANIGFDKLTAMRAASPTGGALGAVTERELALLQATIASLEQSQSEDQFRENLARVELAYGRAVSAINDAYQDDYGTGDVGAGAGDADLIYVPGQGLVPAR